MRKPAFCICENKGTDQLHDNHASDQLLYFRYIDSTILILSKSKMSSFLPSSVVIQLGLCRTWWETLDLKTGYLITPLILYLPPVTMIMTHLRKCGNYTVTRNILCHYFT